MPKRAIASLIVASLMLGLASCAGSSSGRNVCRGLGSWGNSAVGIVLAVPLSVAAGCFDDPNAVDEKPRAAAIRAAADKGDVNAQYVLGQMYEYGIPIPIDSAKAAEWYRKSADRGHTPAQLALARLYEFGVGVPQDDVQADAWYTIAASGDLTSGSAQSAATYRDKIEQRMTPDQITEARDRAQEWKPI